MQSLSVSKNFLIQTFFLSLSSDSHEECENCLETLTELENIDDDVERQKIKMSKTTDASFAEEVGVETYPALVFFKDGVPNLYEGDLTVEEEVLDWLTEMKVESHIELITRPMLETMVEETQYLAVFFCESLFALVQLTEIQK